MTIDKLTAIPGIDAGELLRSYLNLPFFEAVTQAQRSFMWIYSKRMSLQNGFLENKVLKGFAAILNYSFAFTTPKSRISIRTLLRFDHYAATRKTGWLWFKIIFSKETGGIIPIRLKRSATLSILPAGHRRMSSFALMATGRLVTAGLELIGRQMHV